MRIVLAPIQLNIIPTPGIKILAIAFGKKYRVQLVAADETSASVADVGTVPCEECDGTGEVEHDCGCELCCETHEECPECGGSERVVADDAPAPRLVGIHGDTGAGVPMILQTDKTALGTAKTLAGRLAKWGWQNVKIEATRQRRSGKP